MRYYAEKNLPMQHDDGNTVTDEEMNLFVATRISTICHKLLWPFLDGIDKTSYAALKTIASADEGILANCIAYLAMKIVAMECDPEWERKGYKSAEESILALMGTNIVGIASDLCTEFCEKTAKAMDKAVAEAICGKGDKQ